MSMAETARKLFLSRIVAVKPQEEALMPIWSSRARAEAEAKAKAETKALSPPTPMGSEEPQPQDELSPNASRLAV